MGVSVINWSYGSVVIRLCPAIGRFYYTESGGTVTITGYTGTGGAVVIPATIDGMPVVGIGDDAFYILQRFDQRDHPRQRYEHWGLCVLWLHRFDQRDHPQQRYEHWGLVRFSIAPV